MTSVLDHNTMKAYMEITVVQEEMKDNKRSCRKVIAGMYFGQVHTESQEDKHVQSKKKRSKSHGVLTLTNSEMIQRKIGLLERKLNSRITCKVSVVETTTLHRMITVGLTSTNGTI